MDHKYSIYHQVLYLVEHLSELDEVSEVMPPMCGSAMCVVRIICLTCNFEKVRLKR